jgi:hypothetical protein
MFLIKDSNCVKLGSAQKGKFYNWKREAIAGNEIWFSDQVSNQDRKDTYGLSEDKMVFNTTIFISMPVDNAELVGLGIQRISYGLICPDVFERRQSEYKMKHVNNTIYFLYRGNKACGYDLIEASVFLKRHKSLALTLNLISVIILIFGRTKRKKLSLGLSGFEIGLFTAVIFMADFEHHIHLEGSTKALFFICSMLVGLLIGIFSAFSPESAVMLQAFNAATALTFTLTSLYSLTLDVGVSQAVFWVLNITLSIILVAITASPKFIYKYAFKVYINFNQPFYFFYCIAIYFDLYPEMLTMKVADRYGIWFHVNRYTWFVVILQVMLTVILEMEAFGFFKKKEFMEIGEFEERDLLSKMYCQDDGDKRDGYKEE